MKGEVQKMSRCHWYAPLLGMLMLGAAACPPPGKGDKAEAGYKACAPVIAALASYHQAKGRYPESLKELVPGYVDSIPEEVNGLAIEYKPTPTSYSLRFSYEGPGMNTCVYTPETGWSCSGYF
jgi:hypothetical protein